MPYIGRAPKHKNLIIATGHSMMELSLAPFTGKLVAEPVADDATPIDISALSPARFLR